VGFDSSFRTPNTTGFNFYKAQSQHQALMGKFTDAANVAEIRNKHKQTHINFGAGSQQGRELKTQN
jgi:hypothetical protein